MQVEIAGSQWGPKPQAPVPQQCRSQVAAEQVRPSWQAPVPSHVAVQLGPPQSTDPQVLWPIQRMLQLVASPQAIGPVHTPGSRQSMSQAPWPQVRPPWQAL